MRSGGLLLPVRLALALASLISLSPGCDLGDDARRAAGSVEPGEDGPRVVFEPLDRPVPRVPFPNDLLLRPDPSRLSGASWNISPEAPTARERRIRRMLGELDGFGPFAPLTVEFDAPLDLTTLSERAVMVVNIEPGHPEEGAIAALNVGAGRGAFPIDTPEQPSFWPHDPLQDLPDLLFPADNVADLDGDGAAERVSHYEVETHTLILRPLLPLAQGARHAVLITRELKGADGRSVRSPFPFKSHAAQAPLVAKAAELAGVSQSDLAFGWTFTTSDVVTPLANLRAGLHGEGPLAALREAFPARFVEVRDTGVLHDADGERYPEDPGDTPVILQAEYVNDVLSFIAQIEPTVDAELEHVDYLVFGSFASPNLLTGEADTLGLDPITGEGVDRVEPSTVPFLVAVPRATERFQPPFPVVVHFHATMTSRIEAIVFADAMARQGIATVAFDEVGHGPMLSDLNSTLDLEGLGDLKPLVAAFLVDMLAPQRAEELADLPPEEVMLAMHEVGFYNEFTVHGRGIDANGDGFIVTGEAFFDVDPFRQCANFTQGVVDGLQLVRVLRALDPEALPEGVDPSEATLDELLERAVLGDFNGDGVLDIGGPDVSIGLQGMSLGGFHAILTAAIEPEVRTLTPIVTGGGYVDLIFRSNLREVTETLFVDIFGPLVVGCPDGEGGAWLSLNNQSLWCDPALVPDVSFAHLEGVAGAALTLENLSNGERSQTSADAEGAFALAVESDKWDTLLLTLRAGAREREVPIQSPHKGFGFTRNTPDLRRFMNIASHVLDRCDPVNLAHGLIREPLPGHEPTNTLFQNVLGDPVVPISTGLSLARAAGVLGLDQSDWGPVMETLVERGAMVLDSYDIDDVLGDNPPEAPPLGPLPPIRTATGLSAIRFSDVDRVHEWIALLDPGPTFDPPTYTQSQNAIFHRTGGRAIIDDPCLGLAECPLRDLSNDELEALSAR